VEVELAQVTAVVVAVVLHSKSTQFHLDNNLQ
jgi:hypothetical protein